MNAMNPAKATPRILIGIGCLLGSALPHWADTITLATGEVLADVEIKEEGLSAVTYRRDRQDLTVASDDVVSISFERTPEDVDTAIGFRSEGDLLSALQYLDSYVDAQIKRSTERKFPWAPAYAAWTTLELRIQVADLEGAKEAATRLIKNFGASRYVPAAFLAKADSERRTGFPGDAVDTLDEFEKLIAKHSLSKRWSLESRLARTVIAGPRPGEERRAALAAIAGEAGTEHAVVRLRAEVAQGESFLAEADKSANSGDSRALQDRAAKIFEVVIRDRMADNSTLAAAYTGLGDCTFYRGAATDNRADLEQAAMHYLRVITLYKTHSEYVPKCLFYAMRSFQVMGEKGRAKDMARELVSLYPDSEWAKRPEVKN